MSFFAGITVTFANFLTIKLVEERRLASGGRNAVLSPGGGRSSRRVGRVRLADTNMRGARYVRDVLWRLEYFFIIAVRRPGNYLTSLAAVLSGIFNSLTVSQPIKDAIDNIPYVDGSDWLYFIIFTVVLGITFHIIAPVISLFSGVRPFELLTSYMDSSQVVPSLDRYMGNKLQARSAVNTSSSLFDCRFRTIQEDDLELLIQINREVFRFTAFALPLHLVKRRNAALFKANPSIYALIEAKTNGEYIPVGMSCILPLNDIGAALYIRDGGLKDSEIQSRHIASKSEWSNAIVLFAIGILPSSRTLLKNRRELLLDAFGGHLTDLLSEMLMHNPGKTSTYLYAQVEKPQGGIGRLLLRLGFEETDITTGDGCTLWEKEFKVSSLKMNDSL